MIKETYMIIKKNILILIHSRLSAAILIIGPLALVIILNTALGGAELKNIGAAIFIPQNDSQISKVIEGLEKKGFNLIETSKKEECKKKVLSSETNVCIILEKEGERYILTTFLDPSKQNVIWRVYNLIEKTVEENSIELRREKIDLLEEKIDTYLQKIKEVNTKASEASDQLLRIKEVIRDTETKIKEKRITFEQEARNLRINIASIIQTTTILASLEDSNKTGVNDNFKALLEIEREIEKGIIHLQNEIIENQTNTDSISLSTLERKMGQSSSEIDSTIQILQNFKQEISLIEKDLSSLKESNLESTLHPIQIQNQDLLTNSLGVKRTTDLTFIDYLFPSFLSMFVMFTSLLFSTLLIARERVSRAYIRNMIIEKSKRNLVWGSFATILIMTMIQTLAILILSQFLLHLNPLSFAPILILVMFLFSSIFITIGLSLGYLFKSQETALAASLFTGILFLLFSSIISPLESLSPMIREILSYSPIVMSEGIINKVLLFNYSLLSLAKELIIMIASLGILGGLMYYLQYKKRNTEIER